MKSIVITGALGYSGRAIAELFLSRGDAVRTLTNSPNRPNPFGDRLRILPLAFDRPDDLAVSLRRCDCLINTYWVRFNHRLFTFEQAVTNTERLFAAASAAGVRRIVHVSILKPDAGRGLAYYDGKRRLEQSLGQTGIPHTVLRPGVLFGRGDILVNNIAWVLRHAPFFGVFGDGRYRIAPLHVDDLATLALAAADDNEEASVVDCHGPETFEFRELVRRIGDIIGVRRAIVPLPPAIGYLVSRVINPFVRDVIITRQEIEGLMRGLLWSDAPSRGSIRLTDWATSNRETLGRHYASEVGRRVNRDVAYRDA